MGDRIPDRDDRLKAIRRKAMTSKGSPWVKDHAASRLQNAARIWSIKDARRTKTASPPAVCPPE
jgi:hypothetical protein